jgi:hypothetical protein
VQLPHVVLSCKGSPELRWHAGLLSQFNAEYVCARSHTHARVHADAHVGAYLGHARISDPVGMDIYTCMYMHFSCI